LIKRPKFSNLSPQYFEIELSPLFLTLFLFSEILYLANEQKEEKQICFLVETIKEKPNTKTLHTVGEFLNSFSPSLVNHNFFMKIFPILAKAKTHLRVETLFHSSLNIYNLNRATEFQ